VQKVRLWKVERCAWSGSTYGRVFPEVIPWRVTFPPGTAFGTGLNKRLNTHVYAGAKVVAEGQHDVGVFPT